MAPMNNYIIWTSPNTGEYVKADKVEELDDKVFFMKTMGDGTYKLMGTYSKQCEYHEVEL
jgi:phosphotransferase system IIA component